MKKGLTFIKSFVNQSLIKIKPMTTKLLHTMGFDGIPDFFGKYYPLLGSVFSVSLTFGSITGALGKKPTR